MCDIVANQETTGMEEVTQYESKLSAPVNRIFSFLRIGEGEAGWDMIKGWSVCEGCTFCDERDIGWRVEQGGIPHVSTAFYI